MVLKQGEGLGWWCMFLARVCLLATMKQLSRSSQWRCCEGLFGIICWGGGRTMLGVGSGARGHGWDRGLGPEVPVGPTKSNYCWEGCLLGRVLGGMVW